MEKNNVKKTNCLGCKYLRYHHAYDSYVCFKMNLIGEIPGLYLHCPLTTVRIYE